MILTELNETLEAIEARLLRIENRLANLPAPTVVYLNNPQPMRCDPPPVIPPYWMGDRVTCVAPPRRPEACADDGFNTAANPPGTYHPAPRAERVPNCCEHDTDYPTGTSPDYRTFPNDRPC